MFTTLFHHWVNISATIFWDESLQLSNRFTGMAVLHFLAMTWVWYQMYRFFHKEPTYSFTLNASEVIGLEYNTNAIKYWFKS